MKFLIVFAIFATLQLTLAETPTDKGSSATQDVVDGAAVAGTGALAQLQTTAQALVDAVKDVVDEGFTFGVDVGNKVAGVAGRSVGSAVGTATTVTKDVTSGIFESLKNRADSDRALRKAILGF